jgi:hypothetical protein
MSYSGMPIIKTWYHFYQIMYNWVPLKELSYLICFGSSDVKLAGYIIKYVLNIASNYVCHLFYCILYHNLQLCSFLIIS